MKRVLVKVEMILLFDDDDGSLPNGMTDPIQGSCEALVKFMSNHVTPKPIGFENGRIRYEVIEKKR